MASQDVRFVMAVDDQGFIRKMTEAERVLYETKKSADQATSSFSQLFRGFVSGQIVVDAMRKGFGLLKSEISSTINEAMKQEDADRALSAALEITGRSIPLASFKAFATSLQNATKYADDEIQNVMTLLVQMTRLDKEGLQRATRGAIGLATVMRMDLFSAGSLLQKTIEGNWGALSRYGIKVDESLSAGEKQAQLLDKLNTLYTRAEADVGTYSGRLSQLKNAWGDLKETLGETITKSGFVLDYMKDMTKHLQGFSEEARESAFSWQAIFRAMSGGNLAGIIASTAAAQDEAKVGARDLDKEIRALANDFMTGLRPNVEASTVALKAIKAATVDAKKAFKDMADLSLDKLLPWGELSEMSLGEAIEAMFPVEEEFATLSWVEEMRDQWLSVAHGYTLVLKGMTKSTQAETAKQTDYFAGLYNDMARGFASVFMQFRLTTEGFKNFFVGMWQEIKRAFFIILAEMLARWMATAFVRFLIGAFTGPAMPLMSGTGGILPIPAQHGFQGIVNRPTLFLAGEAGPERVNISPTNRGGGGATINVNIYSWDNASMESAVRHRVVPILKEVMAHGDL